MEDFKCLEHDEELMKTLVKKSLDHALLSESSTLKPCPSSNCNGVFRAFDVDDPDDQNYPFFCNFCGVNICRRLNTHFEQALLISYDFEGAAPQCTVG